MARKKNKKAAAGAPAWMVTYSDMVTLLLTFFVLLLSMANMDKRKFFDALGSLKGAFGFLQSSSVSEVNKPQVISYAPMDDDYVSRLYNRVQSMLARLRIDRDIDLVKDRGAVILRVKDAILFDAGSTELKPTALPILREVAGLVKPLPLLLRIEGHTDNQKPANPAITNWDISVQRAVAVLKFFAGEDLLPLDRLSAVGYGDQRPVAPGLGPEQQALNRRVEFVLENLNQYQEQLPYLIDAADQLPF
ncbi:flagellar basal body stator protein MotB [Syntrophotalea carbinolica DSM 2380]|uniref:Flagellar basal body stator protein MotB n=1 Tax=Syntrophotalea carbinolica (strain DSM 2380 / NBRC 103641 / GraBd1) TaxID=338963 RepID=Q3A5D7_SYNC1|nr:flagellar motor protein MotB [Syntrophotalea carbinolica]ABA88420.1 flagellar basal body stator protein MotB [Syntrophotalea carbinolica DSM 2380]